MGRGSIWQQQSKSWCGRSTAIRVNGHFGWQKGGVGALEYCGRLTRRLAIRIRLFVRRRECIGMRGSRQWRGGSTAIHVSLRGILDGKQAELGLWNDVAV